jgi:hypothetical protein
MTETSISPQIHRSDVSGRARCVQLSRRPRRSARDLGLLRQKLPPSICPGAAMSSIGRLVLLAWLAISVLACGSYRYPGRIVSPFNVAMSPILREAKQYPSNPSYNLNDFEPAGGSMQVDTDRDHSSRLDLSFEVYQPLPADFWVGLSVGYLSLGDDYLQSSHLHWWDYVLADRVTLESYAIDRQLSWLAAFEY